MGEPNKPVTKAGDADGLIVAWGVAIAWLCVAIANGWMS